MNPQQLEAWAVGVFTDVGGYDWLNKLVLGGMVVISFLLIIIALLVVYLAFGHEHR